MAKIAAGEFIVNGGELHSRVKRRMLDDHIEDRRDNGLSLDLQLGPPSDSVEGRLNAVMPPTLTGLGMGQHQPMQTLVNDRVNDGQRPATNGVLELLGRTAPVGPPPPAVANPIADVDQPPANGSVQHPPTLTLVNGGVNDGQRPTSNGVLGRMERLPAPVVTATVNHQPLPPANGNAEVASETSPRGRKRPPSRSDHRGQEKSPIIPPPYPWSTDRRAKVYSINTLLTRGITLISGEVQCRHCEVSSEIKFPLVEKFTQIWNFVYTNRVDMHERAPPKWLQPNFPSCRNCGHENSLKPIIADKKRNINWLFLLLGEMVGCCSLEQLKYFCKHTDNHRTGAKNRVLYLTYLTLCLQLNPDSPFRR